VLVTGIRVLDLICPIRFGGTLAIGGDAGSGIVAVTMETMQNVCRRYAAKATCRVTALEPFNESNLRGWIVKLNVQSCIDEVVHGRRAEISIATPTAVVATLLPFAQSNEEADARVVLRRSVLEGGRLPAVELGESWSKLANDDSTRLAQRVKAEVARGNTELASYLSQAFFVAEPWTSRPGEQTERKEMLVHVQGLILGD
jgi:F0F1-type ATP synthase beta subunit